MIKEAIETAIACRDLPFPVEVRVIGGKVSVGSPPPYRAGQRC